MRRKIQSCHLVMLFAMLLAWGASTPIQAKPASDDFIPVQLQTQIAPDVDRFTTNANDYLKDWYKIPQLVAAVKTATDPAVKAQKRRELQNLVDSTRRIVDGTSNIALQINQKLRTANKLTPDLDAFVAKKLANKAGVLKFINQAGGASAFLASSNQRFTEIKLRLDQFLAEADGGTAPRGAATPTPVAAAGSKFVCGVLAFKLVFKTIRGTDTQADADQFIQQCNGVAP